jgi:adenine-specific DNA-methyltransferase
VSPEELEQLVDGLLDRTNGRRVATGAEMVAERQRDLGQFFTPRVVADRVAAESRLPAEGVLRVLDPGAGSGSLAAAVVARVLRERPGMSVEVTAVELDANFLEPLHQTLEDCRRTAEAAGARVDFTVISADFIEWAAEMLGSTLGSQAVPPRFDLVIQNPPYRKIARSSTVRARLANLGVDVPNLYAAFLALGAALLADEGQLVAITPRSFANGTYFRSFRKWLFALVGVDRISHFQERGSLFADLSVLQENIIFAATRGKWSEKVAVVTSRSYGDPTHEHLVRYEDIIKPGDPEIFLHVPTDIDDGRVANDIDGLPASLSDLGVKVSTGKVVDFRATDALRMMPEDGTVPLIYPGHLREGRLQWPLPGYRKPNAIVADASTANLMLPAGTYVLVKRFSAKEETRRVVATVIYESDVPGNQVGIENHLNVFHVDGAGLDDDLAKGLAMWLNSEKLDTHFRQFSGHTQVNATDLRNLRYPSSAQLRRLGNTVRSGEWPSSDEIDALVQELVFAGKDGSEQGGFVDQVPESVQHARELLKAFNFDDERSNERSGLVLRAMLNLLPDEPWGSAENPVLRTVEIMDFLRHRYGRDYKPNTRETIRRRTLHQFAAAGLITQNPDKPDRPINSPQWCYQVTDRALEVIRSYDTKDFDTKIREYLTELPGQLDAYAAERKMRRIPVVLPGGQEVTLSPGGQNELIDSMVKDFCSYFTPGGVVLYVGDAGSKWTVFDETALKRLGVVLNPHGKIPDLIVYMQDKNWLVLLEAAPKHGPVDAKRHAELRTLFAGCTAGLVFVSCFPTRQQMRKYLHEIAWETEVWCADNPTHMIHFNGERFLGPYPAES